MRHRHSNSNVFPRVKEEEIVVMKAWTIRVEVAAQRGVGHFAYRLLKAGYAIFGQFKRILCFKMQVKKGTVL